MKKIFIFSIGAILAITGCQVEQEMLILEEPESSIQRESKVFSATLEDDFDIETKTSLDGEGNVLWKQGDQVSIFAASTVNERYQVSDASDGKTAANLNKIPDGGFVAGTDIDNNVAFYPYASTAELAKSGSNYVISGIELPATQSYASESFGNGAFLMAAVTTSTTDMHLKFKNVLGGLKLQLKGTASIASISITGNQDEILCGAASVTVSTTSTPSINLTDATAMTVTLVCGEGVQLNAETATPFVIALPPMTMEGGFTVVVTDTEGKQMEIKTTKTQTINRSNLLKMPAVEFVGTIPKKALLPYEFLPNEIDKTTITEACFHVSDPTTTATVISAGDSDYEPIYFEMIGTVAHFYTTAQVYKCYSINFEGWKSLRNLDLSMFDVSDSYSMSQAFSGCYNLQSINLSSFDTGNVLYFSNMFSGCKSLRELDIAHFDTAKAISMYGMFQNCQNLRSLNVSGFDTSSVTDLGYMFYNCSSLKQLDISSWNSSSCTNFDSMFSWCASLKQLDVSSWETPACERINSMFSNCHSLESLDVSHFDISKVIDLNSVFHACWNLQTIDMSNWDTSNVGYTRSMFADCKKLRAINLKEWDFREIIMMDSMFMNCYSLESIVLPDTGTPKLQNMEYTFMDCSSLKTITFNGLSTSNVTTMRQLFAACSSLSTLDLSSFNTANVTTMYGMFMGCSSLKDINLSSFDTNNVTDMDYMFSNCYVLSNLNLGTFETTNIEHADGFLEALYNLLKLDLGASDWSSVGLSNSFYGVAERANQCHIRCSVDTKNKIISVRNEMGTDPKYVWYVPEDNLPDNVDGRDPNLYYSSDFTRDRTVFVKQVAIEGNGIDIVFMGDGFSDRLIADGTYDDAMDNVIDAIFSEEPFKSFKDLFNIYVVYAVSENEVIGKNTSFMSYDSRSSWAGAIGAYDESKIWAYANLASEKGDFREVIPVVILNSTTSDGAVWTTTFHAGVNDYYLDPVWDDYHGGQSIAYISGPFTSDISYTAIHEMGHAFGKLADEYVSGYGAINQDVLDMWAPLCIYGMYKNIDFTGDPNSVKWNHFLNDDRYSGESLGCYEGAAQYDYGVWRSTDNSIMRNDANGHFNAPSREAIYYRINKLAYGKNWNYRFEDFVQWDLKKIPQAAHAPTPVKRAFSGNVNRKHIFKMEESITEDGKKLMTIIQN